MNEILRLSSISKTFPGVKALQNISFDLKEGEVHCLCGENGAGKSTLIKILSGAYQPDEGGEIIFDGKKVVLNPHFAQSLGIQTIYQEHIVFDNLNIVENIFTGAEIENGGFLNRAAMKRQTEEVLAYLKSPLRPGSIMKDLSSGEQKTVEIAKGLVFRRRVIILDEPTASFSAAEIENLLEIIDAVKKSGIGIIYISHHLEEVFKIADRVTVLRDGLKVSTYDRANLTKDQLIRDMVGRDPSTFYKRETVPIGEVIFEARGVTGNGATDVSFTLRRGEILGIAGMAGSGRSELMNVLFGSAPLDRGEILIGGKVVKHAAPRDAIKNRMCFITEDRQNTGLFLPQTIAQNIISANLVNMKGMFASPAGDVRTGDRFVQALRIRTRSSRYAGHGALGRQPAESGAGQVVQHQRGDLHLRRADPGHRRGLQAGDLPDHGRPAEAGQGGHHGVLGHARGHLDERQDPRHEGRRCHGRARRRTGSLKRTSSPIP